MGVCVCVCVCVWGGVLMCGGGTEIKLEAPTTPELASLESAAAAN